MASSITEDASEPVYFYGLREKPYGVFSQWQKCKFTDPNYPDIEFNTAEQYMMHGKAQTLNDPDSAAKILLAKTSKDQKALGRNVKNWGQEVWDDAKLGIVERGNYLKFTQNENFKKVLLDTGDRLLVEASDKDKIWGIGFKVAVAKTVPRAKWGQNLLGIALMKVRSKIRAGDEQGDEDVDESDQKDTDQEATDEEPDEQPEILDSSTTTRKRKHDSIAKNSDDEPISPKATSSKKARTDMTAEDVLNSTENKHTENELLETLTKKAAEDSAIHS